MNVDTVIYIVSLITLFELLIALIFIIGYFYLLFICVRGVICNKNIQGKIKFGIGTAFLLIVAFYFLVIMLSLSS